MRLTAAQALVRLLEAEQVPAAFGLVGGKLAPLLHALSQSSIPFVGVRHEASAPMMAAAVYAASGQVALALAEMGPGALNLAAGAGVACNNHLAALFITTNQHRAAAYPHGGMFMDLDTRAVLAPLTKWNAVVHDARRLPELLRTAFREARSGRPGPVHLDIPQDVLTTRCDWPADEFGIPPARYRATQGPRPSALAVDDAVALLRNARRPLLVAGGGVVASGATAQVRALAQRLHAPVVPTQMALGVVPSGDAHFIGHGGLIAGDAVKQAFDDADVIVAIGCRFSSWLWDDHGPFSRRHHRLININIDPSALGAPALHEVAMHADAALALDDLLAALDPTPQAADEPSQAANEPPQATNALTPTMSDKPARLAAADWLARLKAVRTHYEARLDELARDTSPVQHPAALASAIGHALPPDALAVFDGGHTSFWSNDLTPVQAPRTRFHDPGMCQLGFGLPYAMALKHLHPQRPVVNITGDGAFGFTLQELDSARRNRLPVVSIIHNNEAWGVIRAGQRAQLDFELGTSLAGTDYAAIARGFGCHGETVQRAEDLAAALERALASGLPAVLDCRTRFEPHPAMPAFGRMNRYGFDALATPVGPG